MSSTTVASVAASAWRRRVISSVTAGWTMAFSAASCSLSENTISATAARSRVPSARDDARAEALDHPHEDRGARLL